VQAGIDFPEDMEERILVHDLDKFSHHVVVGYSVMFGEGKGLKVLESESERKEWDRALSYHRRQNDHHPEYFYPQKVDGTFEKSTSILSSMPEKVAKSALVECTLDMLASRGERDLKEDDAFSVEKLFNINEIFLKRYAEHDKQYVKTELASYKNRLLAFVLEKMLKSQERFYTPSDQVVVP
jgi:hypothetical protein